MSIKSKKLLYHLTSLDNLLSILENGLLARNELEKFDDVADPDLIDFSAEHGLTKYIRFHFFSQNPFDGDVQKRNPEKEFIYICIHREFAKKSNFKIIPRHPKSMNVLTLYDYTEGIDLIEWDIMDQRDYLDRNCRNICMAECISPVSIMPTEFHSIYVRDDDLEEYVRDMANEIIGAIPFHINVNPCMFLD
ncbi:DUF4433 domain-containing protein [Trichocoleus desertorum AS-A10]|uniref:DarT ssDNA thymidine ADP-ribosyltransferase family protein n=1 Tax=Trichocoleus desertorum TaxID=1481672 RepID=UPI0032993825